MEKIDLMVDYPCPCRRDARLIPISLTDALGCDRCPNVYVVTSEGDQVEQVSGLPAARRRWQWTGKIWQPVRSKQPWRRWIILVAMIILLSIGIWMILHRLSAQWAIYVCVSVVLISPYLIERLSRWVLRQ